MDLTTLKRKLFINNINEKWYSLNETLKPDADILFKKDGKWEFFYLDERGGKNDLKTFSNEEEAYDYLWKQMVARANFFKIPIKDI
jgi:hypothetical protein